MTQAEKFLVLFIKSDVNLFNHLVRESGCCGCCSGSALVGDVPCVLVFSVADLYCLKLFLR